MDPIASLGAAMGSTIDAARQLAAGTERLAEIFQRAGAQLQEVVQDFSLNREGLGEEARSVADLLLAWREVGEVGVMFASEMLKISTCMAKLVNKMELERTQRTAEAKRLNQAWLGTDTKARTWLGRLAERREKPEEAQRRRNDQEIVVSTCLDSVMAQMEAVRLDGRRCVADAVIRAQADAKPVGEKISALKTKWRGGLGHESVKETTLLRLLQRSSEASWDVKDGTDESWPQVVTPAQLGSKTKAGVTTAEDPIDADLPEDSRARPPQPAGDMAADSPPFGSEIEDMPNLTEDEDEPEVGTAHSPASASTSHVENWSASSAPAHNMRNAVDFWRLPALVLDEDISSVPADGVVGVESCGATVADFWRMPMPELSDAEEEGEVEKHEERKQKAFVIHLKGFNGFADEPAESLNNESFVRFLEWVLRHETGNESISSSDFSSLIAQVRWDGDPIDDMSYTQAIPALSAHVPASQFQRSCACDVKELKAVACLVMHADVPDDPKLFESWKLEHFDAFQDSTACAWAKEAISSGKLPISFVTQFPVYTKTEEVARKLCYDDISKLSSAFRRTEAVDDEFLSKEGLGARLKDVLRLTNAERCGPIDLYLPTKFFAGMDGVSKGVTFAIEAFHFFPKDQYRHVFIVQGGGAATMEEFEELGWPLDVVVYGMDAYRYKSSTPEALEQSAPEVRPHDETIFFDAFAKQHECEDVTEAIGIDWKHRHTAQPITILRRGLPVCAGHRKPDEEVEQPNADKDGLCNGTEPVTEQGDEACHSMDKVDQPNADRDGLCNGAEPVTGPADEACHSEVDPQNADKDGLCNVTESVTEPADEACPSMPHAHCTDEDEAAEPEQATPVHSAEDTSLEAEAMVPIQQTEADDEIQTEADAVIQQSKRLEQPIEISKPAEVDSLAESDRAVSSESLEGGL